MRMTMVDMHCLGGGIGGVSVAVDGDDMVMVMVMRMMTKMRIMFGGDNIVDRDCVQDVAHVRRCRIRGIEGQHDRQENGEQCTHDDMDSSSITPPLFLKYRRLLAFLFRCDCGFLPATGQSAPIGAAGSHPQGKAHRALPQLN